MIYNQLVIGVLIPLLLRATTARGHDKFWPRLSGCEGRDLRVDAPLSAEKTLLENGRRQENHDHYPLVN